MKTRIIKVIAFLLAVIIISTGSVFAGNNNKQPAELKIEDSVSIADGKGNTLVAKDLEGGDGLFELYHDGKILSKGYFDRENRVLYEECYSDDDKKLYIFTYDFTIDDTRRLPSAVVEQTRSSTAGVIGYELYDSGNYYVGTTTLSVSGSTGTTTHETYDLYGAYHDIIHLANYISLFVDAPNTIAALMGGDILGALGIDYNFIDQLIPHTNYDCYVYRVNWYCTESGTGHTGGMVSKKYVCSLDNGSSHTYYCDWYQTTALANHNTGLAICIYNTLGAVYTPSPVSWTVYY